jgi:hypothetical protein
MRPSQYLNPCSATPNDYRFNSDVADNTDDSGFELYLCQRKDGDSVVWLNPSPYQEIGELEIELANLFSAPSWIFPEI